MKRAAFLLVLGSIILAFQIISNCSQPLENNDLGGSPSPSPGLRIDTVYVINIDTVVIVHQGSVDTLLIFDTVVQVDTVVLADSPVVDTVVIIIDSGSYGPQMVCARLNSGQQDIVWLLRNREGRYHLEFAALPESDHPTHTLTVDIGGQTYEWSLSESLELILDEDLGANTTIRVTTSKPPSLGHSIDICLTLTKISSDHE